MRPVRLLVLAVLAAVSASCGASEAGNGPIRFGISGGNIAPYTVTIQPNGSVHIRGSEHTSRLHIAPARARQLRREIDGAHLASRRCPGSLPDFAAEYIRVGGRRFVVRGVCEGRFQRVWGDLERAAGLRPS